MSGTRLVPSTRKCVSSCMRKGIFTSNTQSRARNQGNRISFSHSLLHRYVSMEPKRFQCSLSYPTSPCPRHAMHLLSSPPSTIRLQSRPFNYPTSGTHPVVSTHCSAFPIASLSSAASFSTKPGAGNGELNGKVAVVVGGTGGIGESIAYRLAKDGCTVLVVGRSVEKGERIVSALNSVYPSSSGPLYHQFIPCDINNVNDITNLKDTIKQSYAESLYILVNCAGVTYDSLLLRAKDEDILSTISTNLTGVIRVTKELSSIMMRNKSGSIVSIGSVIGDTGNIGQSVYSASKSALKGFTRSISKELGRYNVRANLVTAGFIETDMTKDITDAKRNEYNQQIPLGRFGQPQDVANMVRFLCGSEAEYVTGQVIGVNGGLH